MKWERMEEIIKETLEKEGEYDPIYGEGELARKCVEAIRKEIGVVYKPGPIIQQEWSGRKIGES